MGIAHQHNGIVIYSIIRAYSNSGISYCGVNHLTLAGNSIALAICVNLSATHVWNVLGPNHCSIVYYVGVGIGKVGGLGPIRLDGNGSNTFGYIPVGTLIEDSTTFAVEVLVGAVAVGKVVGRGCNLSIVIGCCVSTRCERACCTAVYFHNLPARHHAVAGIVLGSYIVVERQLNLAVVEVEVLGILVGDVERKATIADACSSRRTINGTAATHTYGHSQSAHCGSNCRYGFRVVYIDVYHRCVFSWSFQDGVGRSSDYLAGFLYPLQHILFAVGACRPPAC